MAKARVNLKRKNRFAGFYTIPGIWAEDVPVFESLGYETGNYVQMRPALLNAMDEIVYEYESASKDFIFRFSRDGFIKYTDEQLAGSSGDLLQRWRTILKSLNVYYMLLDSSMVSKNNLSYFQYSELARYDVLMPSYDQQREFLGFGGPIYSYAKTLASARILRTYSNHDSFLSDDRNEFRQVISPDIFEYACELFDAARQQGLIERLNLLAKSLHEFKSGNFEASVVLSWTVLEQIINDLYAPYDEQQVFWKQVIAILRRKRTDISVRYKLISLKRRNVISIKLFKDLDKVRKRRNQFVHVTTAISIDDAGLGLRLCDELLVKAKLRTNLNISLQATGI